MSRICSNGSWVLIWLGEDVPSDSLSFELLLRWHRRIISQPLSTYEPYTDMFKDPVTRLQAPGWHALRCLLDRRWFRRVWVIQEVVMSKSALVICGSYTTLWDIFEKLMSTLSASCFRSLFAHNANKSADEVTNVVKIRNLRVDVTAGSNFELLGIMSITRRMEATDPRDKVYSLLSLVCDAEWHKVDYERPVNLVFKDLIASNLEHYSDLKFLSYFDVTSLENPSPIATWAPNWMFGDYLRNSFIQRPFNFSTTGDR
jgi:hypothetical protein